MLRLRQPPDRTLQQSCRRRPHDVRLRDAYRTRQKSAFCRLVPCLTVALYHLSRSEAERLIGAYWVIVKLQETTEIPGGSFGSKGNFLFSRHGFAGVHSEARRGLC